MNLGTAINLERGERQRIRAVMDSLRNALENARIEFIPQNGGGQGVPLATRRKRSKEEPTCSEFEKIEANRESLS